MTWFEGVRKGLTCPMCKAKNSFAIKPGTYSTRNQKHGRAKYECSECDHQQVIG